jgi:hypothetical protein
LLYLLDANVLIASANGLYQLDRVPQYWAWLEQMGRQGRIAIPREIWDEFKDGKDLLGVWARSADVKSALLLGEEPDPALVNEVVVDGYAPDLDDSELFELGRDPFLIAYAYAARESRAVVTGEVSKPSRRRARKKVPDVCATLGVQCRDLVALINELDFRIR